MDILLPCSYICILSNKDYNEDGEKMLSIKQTGRLHAAA
jgi:hypothetical protein